MASQRAEDAKERTYRGIVSVRAPASDRYVCCCLESPVAQHKLLVVDDDKLVCWALEKEFRSRGLGVHSVGSAADAVVCLGTRNYELLFLDINLPDRDGLQLLEEIRRLAPLLRTIVLSSEASPQNKRRAFAGGALQFIEKPFELSEIVNVVRSALGAFPEKRRQERYRCRLPLRIAVLTPAQDEAELDLRHLSATTIEVGKGGLRLQTSYPLRPGQRLQIGLISRDDPCSDFVPEDAKAQVIWVDPTAEGVTAGLSCWGADCPVSSMDAFAEPR